MIESYIKTRCGLAKYRELKSKGGWVAKLRLYWFLLFGVLRDVGKKIELDGSSDPHYNLLLSQMDTWTYKSKRLIKKVVDYLALIRYKEF